MIVRVTARRHSNDKITFIKLIRTLAGCGLKEAKFFTEQVVGFCEIAKCEGTEEVRYEFKICEGNSFMMEVNTEYLAKLYLDVMNGAGWNANVSEVYQVIATDTPRIFKVETQR